MKIRFKITVYFTLVTAVLLVLAMCLIYFFSNKGRELRLRKILHNKAQTSANLYVSIKNIDPRLMKIIDSNKKDLLVSEKISIFNEEGKELYTNNDTKQFSQILPDLKKTLSKIKSDKSCYIKVKNLEIIGSIYYYKGKELYLIAGAHDYQGLFNLNNLRKNLTIVFFIILSFLGFLGWVFSKKILQPINNVIKDVNSIESSNLSKRITNTNQKDEIGELILTFNTMIDRIEMAYNIQKNFSSNISHELKNPLTAITSQLEVSLIKGMEKEEYQQLIKSVLEDVYSLNQLTESLILLTKINLRNDVYFDLVRIDEFIIQQVDEYKKKNVLNFELNILSLPKEEESLRYNINRSLLKRCFFNIFDNATKYSIDKTLTIVLKSDEQGFTLEFSNLIDRDQIKITDFQLLLEPFQRGNSTSEIEGYGIGLNLIKQIADLHQFTLDISVSDQQVFHLSLRAKKF